MRRLLVSTIMLIVFGNINAEKIYKSVDEQGNVTYSSQPPADAVKVKPMTPEAGPSAEEVSEAKERSKEIKETGEALSRFSAQPNTKSNIQEKQVEVEEPAGYSTDRNVRDPRNPRGLADPRGPVDPRSPSKVTPVQGRH